VPTGAKDEAAAIVVDNGPDVLRRAVHHVEGFDERGVGGERVIDGIEAALEFAPRAAASRIGVGGTWMGDQSERARDADRLTGRSPCERVRISSHDIEHVRTG
jgi:hypothetical protein